jgi:hypothetical protein
LLRIPATQNALSAKYSISLGCFPIPTWFPPIAQCEAAGIELKEPKGEKKSREAESDPDAKKRHKTAKEPKPEARPASAVSSAKTAIQLYKREHRSAVAEANPEVDPLSLVQMMETSFAALSEEERAPYEAKAAADLERHKTQMAAEVRGKEKRAWRAWGMRIQGDRSTEVDRGPQMPRHGQRRAVKRRALALRSQISHHTPQMRNPLTPCLARPAFILSPVPVFTPLAQSQVSHPSPWPLSIAIPALALVCSACRFCSVRRACLRVVPCGPYSLSQS